MTTGAVVMMTFGCVVVFGGLFTAIFVALKKEKCQEI
ncbi:MetS family NSS transporter small subunit [Fusobacterium sp.]